MYRLNWLKIEMKERPQSFGIKLWHCCRSVVLYGFWFFLCSHNFFLGFDLLEDFSKCVEVEMISMKLISLVALAHSFHTFRGFENFSTIFYDERNKISLTSFMV